MGVPTCEDRRSAAMSNAAATTSRRHHRVCAHQVTCLASGCAEQQETTNDQVHGTWRNKGRGQNWKRPRSPRKQSYSGGNGSKDKHGTTVCFTKAGRCRSAATTLEARRQNQKMPRTRVTTPTVTGATWVQRSCACPLKLSSRKARTSALVEPGLEVMIATDWLPIQRLCARVRVFYGMVW